MIRINQQGDAAAAKRYHSSPAEYHRGGEQEAIGEWFGAGADRLGLHGAIEHDHFARLCDNRHPLTGEQLTARMRQGRRVGYDFNFHACKSLSILHAITGDPAILEALRRAVRKVLRAIERDVRVRVRKDGRRDERVVANLIAAEFLHLTARPANGVIDPHLHIHCFIPNACWDHVEHIWKAIDVAGIKADAPHWQRMFHEDLARRVARLGYPVAWQGKTWEIEGISRDLIERFSGRTVLINGIAARRGITDPAAKDQIGPRTRERKRKDVAMPHLHGEWRGRLTDEERAAIGQIALRRRRPLPDGSLGRESGPAWRQAAQAAATRPDGGRQMPGPAGDGRGPLHDHILRRQQQAAYERAKASGAGARAPSPPPPRQARGHGR